MSLSAIDCFRPSEEGAIGRAIFEYRRALRTNKNIKPEPYADAVVSQFPRANRKEVLEMLYAARNIMRV